MISTRMLVLATTGFLFASTPLYAQDLSRYRDFALGSTTASVAKTGGLASTDIKLIHQRPATIQELRWRPQQRFSGTVMMLDPVREVTFSFYNDQLFQIVVDYDRQRVEGLTDADLIASMTTTYGEPILRATKLQISAPLAEPDVDPVVARWSGTDSTLTLLRGTYPTTLRLVVSLTRVEQLARTASADAVKQDVQDAPQREFDRQKRVAEDGRVAVEKARVTNKAGFKP